MTLTGGEPSFQPIFSENLLSLAKREKINCAMESNMFAPWEVLLPLIEKLDYLMCDLKIWDNTEHKRWTEVGNEQVIKNIGKASKLNIPMIVRVPIVAGINDNEANIEKTAHFLSSLSKQIILELLPYHPLGLSKKLVSKKFTPKQFETPSKVVLKDLAGIGEKYQLDVRIAGISRKTDA